MNSLYLYRKLLSPDEKDLPPMKSISLLSGRPAIEDRDLFLAALRAEQRDCGCTIQAIDAGKMAGERHALQAARNALRAFSERRNVAKDLGMEILRYAAGERQIERAISMGISSSTKRIALVVIHEGSLPDLSSLVIIDGQGLSPDRELLKETFDISQDELSAAGEDRLSDLILERVALVDAYR